MTAERLPRVLGPFGAAVFTVGFTIGSAVFRVPSLVASSTGSVAVSMLLWVIGGVVALCGAFCYSELSVRIQRPGSEYTYGAAAWGPMVGFLIAWATLLSGPASVAAVARAFADYLSVLVTLDESRRRLVAAGLICALTVIAVLSTKASTRLASMAGVAKLTAILSVVAVGLWYRGAIPDAPVLASSGSNMWMHLGPAMVAIIWAYDGFQCVSLLAGEVKTPQRTLPVGLIVGLGLVMTCYLLLNVTYFHVLGLNGVAAAPTVAATTLSVVLGPVGARLIAALVMTCTLGTVAAQCVSMPRYYLAPAEDGVFPGFLARVSERARTPVNAIVLLGGVAISLVVSGGYLFLIRLVVLSLYPLVCVALLGAVRLRRRDGPPTGFSMPLYPLPLIVFVAGITIAVISSLFDDPMGSMFGIAMPIVGAVIYRLAVRQHVRTA